MLHYWKRFAVGLLLASIVYADSSTEASAGQVNIERLEKQYSNLFAAGDYAGALVEALKIEAEIKARFGSTHPNYARILYKLARVYREQGKWADSERLLQRVLVIREEALGMNHPNIASSLNEIAAIYRDTGKYAEAEKLYRRSLAIDEKALGPNHSNLAAGLNNLANLYQDQGKYTEAVGLYRRSLAIAEKALGPKHPNFAVGLSNLAELYRTSGKHAEAEGLFQRALVIAETALGPKHPSLAASLSNLGMLYQGQGKYTEAEELFQRSLVIAETALGPKHPSLAAGLNNLASLYEDQGKYTEAEGLYQRSLAIAETSLGPKHPTFAATLNNIGGLNRLQGRYAEAEKFLKRALTIKEEVLGENHPDVAPTLNQLALIGRRTGDRETALAYARRASHAVLGHASTEVLIAPSATSTLIEGRARYFHRHLTDLAAVAAQKPDKTDDLGREAFEIGQWSTQSSAARAVQQMSARFVTGRDPLNEIVRQNQDFSTIWNERNRTLIVALSKPEGQQDRLVISRARQQLREIESRLALNTAQLNREFPSFVELTKPQPLKITEVQDLLKADEALAVLLVGDQQSYVFMVTREGFSWETIPLGTQALIEKVSAFRRGLDVNEVTQSIENGKPELFDLNFAHELYSALIGPVATILKGKRHLLVVPSGPLTSLPFHLLVTEKPYPQSHDVNDPMIYKEAAWLLKQQAVTVLPSVTSLKALRITARMDRAGKPLIGFGDPVFMPKAHRAVEQRTSELKSSQAPAPTQEGDNDRSKKSRTTTRAYTDFWRGAGVDRDKLANALPALPETADELKAVAQKLGAPLSDIRLREEASEAKVKHAQLSDYRIVYFATHGLIAGDVKGLGEPSLALTLPLRTSDLDDGLLTASEVAQLKLNADWVVLSACNTAAGEKPGAEALSGLARAFFYSGARALLVSHWAVESQAATRITTSTFDIMSSNPELGRSEALRRAMLSYMNDTSAQNNAYPAYWGPFSIVGDGSSQ